MSKRHREYTRCRSLSMETLEGRRLLITGVPLADVPQNFANPEDVNNDGVVSPADALIVINRLNNPDQSGTQGDSFTDVDGDGVRSPRDALLVINRLNSRSDTSSVPPEQRAIGLRKALDAGYLPSGMSLSQAQELLETLENGGHYEAGERYRNGQMININDPLGDTGDSVAAAEGEASPVTVQTAGSVVAELLPETASDESAEEDDPFALLRSVDEALTEYLHDSTLWQRFTESTESDRLEFVERVANRLSDQLAERLNDSGVRERLAQVITDAFEDGDKTIEDIIGELQTLRGTLGDANSQIAQIFANLDIEGIIDRLGVDLGSLAEAALSQGQSHASNHVEAVARFLGRDYLQSLSDLLD
ncbi:MAG: hypothetical protein H6822_13660 [Planctomycetaceae bacterium]|nr:hypothetical protein [Planctomycetales bacterium]MCB9923223.1 hypothetical protein [Planctomycetaceae bacterium]